MVAVLQSELRGRGRGCRRDRRMERSLVASSLSEAPWKCCLCRCMLFLVHFPTCRQGTDKTRCFLTCLSIAQSCSTSDWPKLLPARTGSDSNRCFPPPPALSPDCLLMSHLPRSCLPLCCPWDTAQWSPSKLLGIFNFPQKSPLRHIPSAYETCISHESSRCSPAEHQGPALWLSLYWPVIQPYVQYSSKACTTPSR